MCNKTFGTDLDQEPLGSGSRSQGLPEQVLGKMRIMFHAVLEVTVSLKKIINESPMQD